MSGCTPSVTAPRLAGRRGAPRILAELPAVLPGPRERPRPTDGRRPSSGLGVRESHELAQVIMAELGLPGQRMGEGFGSL